MNEKFDFQNSSISKRRKLIYKIAIGILIAIFFSGIAALSVLSENRNSDWIFEENILSDYVNSSYSIPDLSEINAQEESVPEELFPVYIVGEIVNPGIYYVENFIYLFELVDLAGGFTKNAASDEINLVYLINESRTIRIPSCSEISSNSDINYTEEILTGNNSSGSQNQSDKKVNINTADKALLETLPGIGPSTADAIISYRNKFGSFKSIEDIMSVSGIKENKFNLIRDKISIAN